MNPGVPAQLALIAQAATAPANTAITPPLQVVVEDAAGARLANEPVTFTVTAGGGSLASASAVSDANGVVTMPAWTLGKSAVPQAVQAKINNVTLDIPASVLTQFNIEVRFFGTPMTAEQQALFSAAAARLRGVITGDVENVQTTANENLATDCGVAGLPTVNSLQIDDVIIYAAIENIDGPGKILAQAGPCLDRVNASVSGTDTTYIPAIGVMQFDQADINSLAGSGSLQEVITHEMMHVLGFGVLWDADVPALIVGQGTADSRYIGAGGVQGCQNVGGTTTCATSVPVENNGVEGTADSHWRETTFDNELMTGYIDASPNPLSAMSVLSLRDLGYAVNGADFDTYFFPSGSLRAALSAAPITATGPWERRLPVRNILWLDRRGAMHRGKPLK